MATLFGVPLSVISTIVGYVMSAWTTKQKAKAESDERMQRFQMEMMAATNENAVKFLKEKRALIKADPHFTWTRRTLALGIVFGSMVAFFVAPYIFTDVKYIWQVDVQTGVLWWKKNVTEFVLHAGIPFAVVDAFLSFLGLITGFYFGQSAASGRGQGSQS